MHILKKLLLTPLLFFVVVSVLIGAGAVGAYLYLSPKLPATEVLKDIQFQVPLRVFTADGVLIAEFGEKRRTPVTYDHVPNLMVKAVLAAEDDRFFEHPGVDYQGLIRAAWNLLRTGEKGQGGSTITMQVARNFFLTSEKTFLRKFNEILLSLKIEHELNKREILELYLNKIYLGNRAYGVEAAAEVYYGKPLAELDLHQFAMIAGLPKAPSRYNPIADPARAMARRDYVLGRMLELGYIDEATYQDALATPDDSRYHGVVADVTADYVAEMVRAEMVERYGDTAYTDGFNAYATISSARQKTANKALESALLEYDVRHGYRGPEARTDPATPDAGLALLRKTPVVGGLKPALVLTVAEQSAKVQLADGQQVELGWDGISWARKYLNEDAMGASPKKASDVLAPGDIVRVTQDDKGKWLLRQQPQVEGALIALDPNSGAIVSLVGGFDFNRSKFNRVTQAQRQPGSNFKPFVYSAALEKGFTPASIINDAPVVFEDAGAEGMWRPENYSGKFYGPTRLRTALTLSRNLVSIRLLRDIGIEYAVDYVQRFGFPADRLPRNLTLALGTGVFTPQEMVRGFATFANGGFRVEPYILARIEDSQGETLFEATPPRACPDCVTDTPDVTPSVTDANGTPLAPRVITPQNAYLMSSIMRDVIQFGTARRARSLGRTDLSGKTGTTNDAQDAWFSGFNADLVATCWVGFDQPRSLGARETGGRAALPMWMEFMSAALAGKPEHTMAEPPGLVTVRIDPTTGLLARSDQSDAIFETFRTDTVPQQTAAPLSTGSTGSGGTVPEQIF